MACQSLNYLYAEEIFMGQTDLKVYTAILKGKQPGNKGLYLSSWIVKTDPRIYNPAEIMEVQFFYSLAYCIFEVNTKIEGGDEHKKLQHC